MSDKPTQALHTSIALLEATMRRAGWEIAYVDLDLTRGAPQAEIKVVRDDGRWLWAKVDSLGRASVERFQRNSWLGKTSNAKGRVPLSPQVSDDFLGRSGYAGARAMLRDLTGYLVENALQPIALRDMRTAWASVMHAPLLLGRSVETMKAAP